MEASLPTLLFPALVQLCKAHSREPPHLALFYFIWQKSGRGSPGTSHPYPGWIPPFGSEDPYPRRHCSIASADHFRVCRNHGCFPGLGSVVAVRALGECRREAFKPQLCWTQTGLCVCLGKSPNLSQPVSPSMKPLIRFMSWLNYICSQHAAWLIVWSFSSSIDPDKNLSPLLGS